MRLLIVEDEPAVARRLERLLRELAGKSLTELGHAASLADARSRLGESEWDLLFLDLNLQGRDGFDLLAEAVAGPQQTVVVSANTDRALEAFEYGVIDFVPKPFGSERLATTLDRVQRRGQPRHPARYLAFRLGGGTEVIAVDQVRAIHGADHYAEVELLNGRRLLHDKTLESLETLLPGDFKRIHRSHLVRLACVRRLRSLPGSRYRVELDSGDSLPVGRSRVKGLREWLV